MSLEREDYVEPACVLCGKPGEEQRAEPVPLGRILDRLRQYEDRSDWAAAERHLLYWLAEAEQNRDLRGQLMLNNELMGFYRKQGDREKALYHADQAERLVDALDMGETVTAGTTWINAGTVREAFGDPAAGLRCFEKARANYERLLDRRDSRLGGLYNNMALALTALEEYREAEVLFRLALDVMEHQENGELEQAITWLNMADALEAEVGMEQAESTAEEYLDRAMELLNAEHLPRNGYYAFVCEKCAPVYGHYGFFLQEAELNRRAAEILENGPESD
ncbi:MAG: tetratricopeptide repeat protein [Clostridiales bacterium]|nr:tetratricopeptide repeat protein [Clostridiales bacterium]